MNDSAVVGLPEADPDREERPGGSIALFGSLGAVILLTSIAVFAPLFAPHDPLRQDLIARLAPPVWDQAGRPDHVLGTDQLGRDVLSRILHGARTTLFLSFSAVTLAAILGVSLGLIAGYVRGSLDILLLRFSDVQLAFPFLVLAIAMIAIFGPSLTNLVLVLVIWSWPPFMRLARAQVLVEKEREYVLAVRSLGATPLRIVLRHLLPNTLPSLVVLWAFTVAQIIIVESSLSFLGFGVPPPTPTWGGMLSDGRNYIGQAPWLITLPGLAVMLTVMTVNALGDALARQVGEGEHVPSML